MSVVVRDVALVAPGGELIMGLAAVRMRFALRSPERVKCTHITFACSSTVLPAASMEPGARDDPRTHFTIMSKLTAELDLAIANMNTEILEQRASEVVRRIPGVEAARLIPGGIWMRYRPSDTDERRIIKALHDEGFRATLFQDSATGKTGHVSY